MTSLAMTTFCWLPPDNAPTTISGRCGRTSKARIASRASARSRDGDMRNSGETRSSTVKTTLRPTVSRISRPLPRRSSVTRPSPSPRAFRIEVRRAGAPSISTRPDHLPAPAAPYSAVRSSVRPAPMIPARPTISPSRTSSVTSSGACHPGLAFCGAKLACSRRKHRFAEFRRPARIKLVERTPDKEPHQLRLRRIGRLNAGDLTVAHDRHPVGDARNLLEPVRDIDDADASAPRSRASL